MSVFFVDSNILIFAELDEYPEHKLAVNKIDEISHNNTLAVNNVIISEVFHKLSALLNRREAKKKVEGILESSHIKYITIEKSTVKSALDLPEKYNIRINDALIAQHVFDAKCDGILTDNVKDFKRIRGLNVINLR